MANWILRIDVTDIWEEYSEDEDFELFKEKLIPILKSKTEEIEDLLGEDEASAYESLIDDIEYGVDNIEEFDYAWNNLYDWADINRVWIATTF